MTADGRTSNEARYLLIAALTERICEEQQGLPDDEALGAFQNLLAEITLCNSGFRSRGVDYRRLRRRNGTEELQDSRSSVDSADVWPGEDSEAAESGLGDESPRRGTWPPWAQWEVIVSVHRLDSGTRLPTE